MALVSLTNVTKTYPAADTGGAPVVAVDGVSLDIEAGDVYGIIGYSGAGKSTLVRLVNALEPATSGRITVDGRDITEHARARAPRHPARHRHDLPAVQPVRLEDGVAERRLPAEGRGASKAEIAARVAELLDFVGLADKARNYPDQLSGGQKQRVGIARALATSPRLLLADEATSALDPETTQEVLALLKRVNREFGVTIIVITHEMDVIQSIATKVAVMDGGRVIEHGDVFEVFSNPQNPSSQRFVSTVVKGIPSPAELAVLRERHEGRIVTISFRDGDASQAAVFLELATAGPRVRARVRRHQRHPGPRVRAPHARDPRRGCRDRRRARAHRRTRRRDGGGVMDRLFELQGEFWVAAVETLYMVALTLLIGGFAGLVLGIVLYTTRPGSLLSNRARVQRGQRRHQLLPADPVHHLHRRGAAALAARDRHGHRQQRAHLRALARGLVRDRTHRGAEPAHGVARRDRGGAVDGRGAAPDPAHGRDPRGAGPLILGYTFVLVAIVDMTAVAGLIGGGGLGTFAQVYGYRQFEPVITWAAVLLIVVFVQGVQFLGNWLARKVLRR